MTAVNDLTSTDWNNFSSGDAQRPLQRQFSAAAVGLIFTLLIHGSIIFCMWWKGDLAANDEISEPRYVVAKLVRLGKPRDPKKLPNKVVPPPPPPPVAEPAPPEPTPTPTPAVAPTKVVEAVTPKKTERPPDRKATPAEPSKDLRSAFERAATLAAAEREIEQEGQPDGVASGTVDQAEDGDVYLTRIADLWNRTWSLPSIIPADEAKSLYVLVVVHIDRQGNIRQPIEIDRPSGNSHFDTSITEAWQRIGQLPLPPPDRLAEILANGLALKLNWKGLN